jgi:putative ATPase
MYGHAPLAERMRPKKLSDFVGQTHLLREGSVLYNVISQGKFMPSMVFWGPPGVGKTTLANLIAKSSDSPFYALSAVQAGVKDVREVIDSASKNGALFQKPVLFIDEIHRFSKSQQDALLNAVEKGVVTLIGATTENPSFEVIPALLSRCQVYILKELTSDELIAMLQRALKEDDFLKHRSIQIESYDALLRLSGGDGRKLLNLLELVIESQAEGDLIITDEQVTEVAQHKMLRYDKTGEQHYDIISAFIKSMRGSDPDAAVYWLARMLGAGEDPKFIARRMLILASEDIGNANLTALIMANNCFQAVTFIGMPECDLILAQTAIYLACSAKSNSVYRAIRNAQKTVRETGDLSVPLHLRNAPTALMKEIGYGKEYLYAHDFPGNFVQQQFLPDEIQQNRFYTPGQNPREKEFYERLIKLWGNRFSGMEE